MKKYPRHIAFIMDGNRRWAVKSRLNPYQGHKKGESVIEPIVDYSIKLKIPYLTFWAFSTENWHRNKKEVQFLLNLYRTLLDKKVTDFHKKNVRVKVLGNLDMFPGDLRAKTAAWMEKTRHNNKITVNIALSYGGRDELIRAVNLWHNKHRSAANSLTAGKLADYLDTAGQPDPDLLIRTGGEKRLSGFLLWQLEYAELYFTDILWPDFSVAEYKKVLTEFQKRQRRYGK